MDVAELVFLKDEEPLLKLRLDRAEVCIGSNPTCDVVVPDPEVPEVAALLIDRGARRFRLRDLTNGSVLLNGGRIEGDEADLGDGDRITVGHQAMRLSIRAGEAERHKYGKTSVLDVEQSGLARAAIVHRGVLHAIEPGRPFNVGGHEDNEIHLEDPFVSSFHCRISNRTGRWFLEDLESTNGTEVNGLRVMEAELPTPATIKIGQEILSFSAESVEERVEAPDFFHGMLGTGEKMKRVFDLIRRLSDAREPVLITGESGSGKELVARGLHDESMRRSGPYLALNCGALSSTLIESELFGHMKGAFTGATDTKEGAFEATSGGTLFLDEIGELPLDLQPKLLRVLETSTVRRVGDTKERHVDTRIIAATHRNLEELVAEGELPRRPLPSALRALDPDPSARRADGGHHPAGGALHSDAGLEAPDPHPRSARGGPRLHLAGQHPRAEERHRSRHSVDRRRRDPRRRPTVLARCVHLAQQGRAPFGAPARRGGAKPAVGRARSGEG